MQKHYQHMPLRYQIKCDPYKLYTLVHERADHYGMTLSAFSACIGRKCEQSTDYLINRMNRSKETSYITPAAAEALKAYGIQDTDYRLEDDTCQTADQITPAPLQEKGLASITGIKEKIQLHAIKHGVSYTNYTRQLCEEAGECDDYLRNAIHNSRPLSPSIQRVLIKHGIISDIDQVELSESGPLVSEPASERTTDSIILSALRSAFAGAIHDVLAGTNMLNAINAVREALDAIKDLEKENSEISRAILEILESIK